MPIPAFRPMPLARGRAPFDHPDWVFELKYDGFRALLHVENGRARLLSRNGNTFQTFPALTGVLAQALDLREAVLDGEIVHLGPDGRPLFYDLMRRREPQHFCAFDLLWLGGRDLRNLPLLARKRLLRRIVPRVPSPLLYVDHLAGNGTALYRAVCEHDLEGIVAKLGGAAYTPDATTWMKIKNPAYSQAAGRHDFFNARAASIA